MALAIEAQRLSKRYRIGQMQAAYGTLRDSVSRTAARLTGREEAQARQEIWALRDVSVRASVKARRSASSAATAQASPRC